MNDNLEIRNIYDGKYEGLHRFIEQEVSKSHSKLGQEGLLFVGVIMNKDGQAHKADYVYPRIRPAKDNKVDEWMIGFRLSMLLQSLVNIEDGDNCKVGLVMRRIDV